MDTGNRGVDPQIKIQAIQECLEKHFTGVKFSESVRPTFTFHNEVPRLPWLLVINPEFLSDPRPIEELIRFIEGKVIKKISENPGKRIQISKTWDITVEERNLS